MVLQWGSFLDFPIVFQKKRVENKTPLLHGTRVGNKIKLFCNFMPGAFVKQLHVHAPYGAEGEESFILVFIRKISAVLRRSHAAFFGDPTRKVVGQGRRTPNSISHHVEHGSHFC